MAGSADPVGEAVGLVVGTVPATPLQFSVGLAPGQYLQLDDVVVARRELPGQPPIRISGVVTNVEAVHEGARFASDVFLIEQGALPAEISEVAEVTVTRVEPEMYVLSAAEQGGHGLAGQRAGAVRQPHDDRVLVQRGPDQPVLQRHPWSRCVAVATRPDASRPGRRARSAGSSSSRPSRSRGRVFGASGMFPSQPAGDRQGNPAGQCGPRYRCAQRRASAALRRR